MENELSSARPRFRYLSIVATLMQRLRTYRVSKWIRFTDDVSPAREDIVRARFRVVG